MALLTSWSLGLFFLGCVVLLWVLSSFLLNGIFEQGIYNKPLLITWLNTTSFIVYLLPYYVEKQAKMLGKGRSIPSYLTGASYEDAEEDEEACIIPDDEASNTESLVIVDSRTELEQMEPLTVPETVRLSFWFSILWFTSNLLNNASLSYTSVSSQTILASTSSLFTMLIGYLASIETLSKAKLVAVGLSLLGIVLVTQNDDPGTGADPFKIMIGNLLALGGALCYGVYSILLKLVVKEDSRIDMRLFFGFVGLFNMLVLWPPIVIMNRLGFEKFEMPPSLNVWAVILLNCATSFLGDFLWARAMLLTSPLTVTLGLSMTIPVAMVCDFLFKFKLNSAVYTMGATLICFSFYLVNKAEQAR